MQELQSLIDLLKRLTASAGKECAEAAPETEEESQVAQAVNTLAQALAQREAERVSQVEAARQELDAFSYAVAHDLRAPLRAIDGFSRLLFEEPSTSLPLEARHYLQRVRQNAQQMVQMLDGLLAFSRVSRHILCKQLVAPASLVQQVWEKFRVQRDNRPVLLTLNEMPPCQADPVLLKHVFTHLMDNGLKFTRPRPEARIEVGCRREPTCLVYFVKDNGVGFDMRYAPSLFGMFQKLHAAEEYEGVGVGLAIARRSVQQHGGRIWAEAEVDKGAVFFFTLT